MAQEFIPQMEPRHHPSMTGQLREDQLMKKYGLKKRSTWRGYRLSILKEQVGESVYVNWSDARPNEYFTLSIISLTS